MSIVASCTRKRLGRMEDLVSVGDFPHVESDLDTDVERVVLSSPNQSIVVTVSSLGCRVESVVVKSVGEVLATGSDNSAVLGRVWGATEKYKVATRTLRGSAEDEVEYEHDADAAEVGFANRNWKLANTFCSQRGARAVFELESEHMDQGHPGAVKIEAHLSAVEDASGQARFELRYRARLARDSPTNAYCNLTSALRFALDADSATLWVPPSGILAGGDASKQQFAMPSKLPTNLDPEQFSVAPNETKIAAEVSSQKFKLTVRTTVPVVSISTDDKHAVMIQPHHKDKQLLQGLESCPSSPSSSAGSPLFRRLAVNRRGSFTAASSQQASYDYEYDEYTAFQFSISLFG